MSSKPERNVFLVRHAERIDFVDPRWSESAEHPYDPPLSPNGLIQARDLARRLGREKIDHIISSPFMRTLQTASIVADALDLPVKVEDGASENLQAQWFPYDPRTWTLEERAKVFPRIDTSYQSLHPRRYPEMWEDCVRECGIAMRKIVEHCPGNLLVVAHGASRSGLGWGLVDGYPQFAAGLCALVTLVQNGDGRWEVACAGETDFLTYVEPETRLV